MALQEEVVFRDAECPRYESRRPHWDLMLSRAFAVAGRKSVEGPVLQRETRDGSATPRDRGRASVLGALSVRRKPQVLGGKGVRVLACPRHSRPHNARICRAPMCIPRHAVVE